mmetsp:Transcript_83154/g.269205  ORF Transcript_83154/g.269205 Transcript_83154/m.269205 type:complete len:384 (+) Transcript_83154:95-1246(+)
MAMAEHVATMALNGHALPQLPLLVGPISGLLPLRRRRRSLRSALALAALVAAVVLAFCGTASLSSMGWQVLPGFGSAGLAARAASRRRCSASASVSACRAAALEAAAASPAQVADDATAAVDEAWEAEATRCWSLGADGQIPGLIAEMCPAGREYDWKARRYIVSPFLSKLAAQAAAADRPWRRQPGERAAREIPGGMKTDADFTEGYRSGWEAQGIQDSAMALSYLGQACEPGRSSTMLDLGCGDGSMARSLIQSPAVGRVFAIDCARKELEAARELAEKQGLVPEDGLFFVRADAQALPFRDGQVDGIWCGACLHVVEDPAAALRGLLAALRPGGGRLVATTPAESFGAKQLEAMAKEAGFSEVTIKVPRHGVFALQAMRA